MSYVLFTPVGGHDPIAGYHDGAILHICRVYRPEKVFLYLSQEMLERSRQDDRYRQSLQKLQQQLNYEMEIHQIEREQLTQVQLFDTFYTDFDRLLREIHAENPQSTLLLNLSSGTPAMKSALNVISVLAQYPMLAVQVSTPHKKENPKAEDPKDYDVEAFWECNEDNKADFDNRCREVEGEHLLVKIKKESIRRLLDAYNYKAALLLAQDIAEFIPAETMHMLEAAKYRLQLDQSNYAKAMQGLEQKFQPIEMGDQRLLFEYVLSLQIKLKQENYADFLRGLTPAVLDLFLMCLKNQLKITPELFCRKTNSGSYRISESVMLQSEIGKKIRQALQHGFNDMNIRETDLGSAQIMKIFEYMLDNSSLKDDLQKMRDVETNVRNIAAHEIVSVKDDWIQHRTQMSAENIMTLLKRLLIYAGVNVKKEYWNSFDDMNSVIAANL